MDKILFIQYFVWHFYDVPKEIIRGWKNFLYFSINYFSLPLLLRTFFCHWRKYYYSYGKSLDFSRYLEAFLFNVILSRGVGILLRTIFIITALIIIILILLLGFLILITWILLPFVLVFLLISGFKIIYV